MVSPLDGAGRADSASIKATDVSSDEALAGDKRSGCALNAPSSLHVAARRDWSDSAQDDVMEISSAKFKAFSFCFGEWLEI
jgi:hypothetical protein